MKKRGVATGRVGRKRQPLYGGIQVVESTAPRTPLGAILRHGQYNNSLGPYDGRRLKHFCLVYTLRGSTPYEDHVIGKTLLKAGDLLLIHPKIAHWYGNGDDGAFILLGVASAHSQILIEDGSTFTPGANDVTPNTAASFNLNAITLQNQGSGNGFQFNTDALGIHSVSGTTLTYIGGGSFTYSAADQTAGGTAVGDYFTLNLATPVVLQGNTVYAFTFNRTSGGGYLGLDGGYSNNNSYPGGTAITATLNSYPNPSLGGTITTPDPTPYDRNFDVALSLAPEPSTWAMMLGGLVFLAAWTRRRLQA